MELTNWSELLHVVRSRRQVLFLVLLLLLVLVVRRHARHAHELPPSPTLDLRFLLYVVKLLRLLGRAFIRRLLEWNRDRLERTFLRDLEGSREVVSLHCVRLLRLARLHVVKSSVLLVGVVHDGLLEVGD